MYLQQLYKTHKGWFVLIILFATIQLALDVRRDASVTPFYHYGMYSRIIKPENSYEVALIKVNGELLQTKNFTPQQWDNVMQPVLLYKQQQQWNSNIYNKQVKRLLHITDSTNYVNTLDATAFEAWYKQYLQQLLQEKVNAISINFSAAAFNGETLAAAHE